MKLKNCAILILIILGCFLLLGPVWAWQFSDIGTFTSTSAEEAGLTQSDYATIVANILTRIFLPLVGALFVILFIYGGFLWMTSAGSDEKINKAKKIFTYAVVGVLVVSSAYSITLFITSGMPSGPSASTTDFTPFTYDVNGVAMSSCATQGGVCVTASYCTNSVAGTYDPANPVDCPTGNICCFPPATPTATKCNDRGGICTTYDECLNTYQGAPWPDRMPDCQDLRCCITPTQTQPCTRCGAGSGICSKSECEDLGCNCKYTAIGIPHCEYVPNYNNGGPRCSGTIQ
ncbi:MAG: hypothetical protein A2Y82_00885 [Candidatus Buchananbacteria bacterium RBG_13_36_9]|uniref:Uncharacterized protein n=1 Tax=Candidatus Buchananbacteria bacterium RBG_13_36_9 TaxID=1797530 RepID=A0A1G1XNA1_9BACT|nr:MAG: hypothetical protein A2Y82_00885 [Candidatus Buchananbacteria bacterium RBG_13_36_9]